MRYWKRHSSHQTWDITVGHKMWWLIKMVYNWLFTIYTFTEYKIVNRGGKELFRYCPTSKSWWCKWCHTMICDIVWKLMSWLWSKAKSFIRIFYISLEMAVTEEDGACFDVKNDELPQSPSNYVWHRWTFAILKHWLCLRGHCTTILNINNSRLSKPADLMTGIGRMRSNLGQPIRQGGSAL